jgi:hypothetical protein
MAQDGGMRDLAFSRLPKIVEGICSQAEGFTKWTWHMLSSRKQQLSLSLLKNGSATVLSLFATSTQYSLKNSSGAMPMNSLSLKISSSVNGTSLPLQQAPHRLQTKQPSSFLSISPVERIVYPFYKGCCGMLTYFVSGIADKKSLFCY